MSEPITELIGQTISRAGRTETVIDARQAADGLLVRTKTADGRVWEYRGIYKLDEIIGNYTPPGEPVVLTEG